MTLLSIDIGIKNLSFCLFDIDSTNKYSILQWNNINLTEQSNNIQCHICGKKAKYTKDNVSYCLKHSKQTSFLVPCTQLKNSYLSKQNADYLLQLAKDLHLVNQHQLTTSTKKKEILQILNNHILNHSFQEIKNTNACKIDLVTIGKNLVFHFDKILDKYINTIDKIIIENQNYSRNDFTVFYYEK